MDCKADNPDSTALSDNLRSPDNPFPAFFSSSIDKQQLVDLYYSRIYSSIARLTGMKDADEIETLTVNTLRQLWKDRRLLAKEKRQGIFIYKVLLRRVFRYLKKQGNKERIRLLRDVLPIAPACYLYTIAPIRGTLYSYLLKIKKLWKTF